MTDFHIVIVSGAAGALVGWVTAKIVYFIISFLTRSR